MKYIYLDHIATNPIHPEVLDAMLPYFKEDFGNPLSIYPLGLSAREGVEDARRQVASLINAKPSEIVFTSSGAESNNFAIHGVALARQRTGKHIIISKMEHHSVMNPARVLERDGFKVTYVNPDRYGYIDPETIRQSITDETILISVIHASSEVGTVEPIAEIGQIAKEKAIAFHTDAVASTGNIPIDVKALGVNLLSMSAHQFYGPKGAAALYIKEGTRIVPLIYGGTQEGGRRAGTENVPAIIGMGKAAELAEKQMQQRMEHVQKLRDKIIESLLKIDKVILTGHPEKRLPGHASFVVEHVEGEGMLLLLSGEKISAASGSACTSKALKASPVLSAMGFEAHMSHGSIVFSPGIDTTEEDIDCFIEAFNKIVERLRKMSPFA